MTAALTEGPAASVDRRLSPAAVVVAAAVGITLLGFVRQVTGAHDLTSSGTFAATLRLAVPIGLAGLGALWCERAGVVNIGIEGMMILGTWFGAWAGSNWGVWWGVVLGVAGGALGGLVHAVATVTFGVDHIVSGVAINILAGGVARYLSVIAYGDDPRAGATQSPPVEGAIGAWSAPLLAGGDIGGWTTPDVLRWLERRRWFLVSDVAGLARGLTGDLHLLTILSAALVPVSAFVLWRTAFGLRLRSVGEAPAAAESLGVRVYGMKYAAVVISGAFAGLAGAFLVIISSGIYREGQTGGRGFIGLATMIFGNWRPYGAAAGSGVFGFADALQLRSAKAVHAVLLFVALVSTVFAVRALRRRRRWAAGGYAVTAAAFGVWFTASDSVPSQFVTFTPHVTTLLVLSLSARRLRPPAADGRPYRKGEV